MFSNDYKYEMIKKFNLTESVINSPKHYKIPNFVFKTKNEINNQCQYHHPTNSLFKLQLKTYPYLLIDKSSNLNKCAKTNYSENKKKNIFKLLTNVQREKIDLLINRAYHKINNEIREYNKSVSIPKKKVKFKLQSMPYITKELIIDHVMGQVQKYLPDRNRNKTSTFYDYDDYSKDKLYKQFIWSHNFMEEKKMDEYKKRYRIKYIDGKNKIVENKLIKEKHKRDKDLPNIFKIKTEMFFSSQKNKTYSLDKNLNKSNKTHQIMNLKINNK